MHNGYINPPTVQKIVQNNCRSFIYIYIYIYIYMGENYKLVHACMLINLLAGQLKAFCKTIREYLIEV